MNNNKKYPKSKKKFQCLGPCYYPNTMVIHPITLELTTNKKDPFCPVNEYYNKDHKRNEIIDLCYNPTEKKDLNKEELELNMLLPFIDFNTEMFLKTLYNIYSFEECIEWLEKNIHLPFGTRQRIFNTSLIAYGSSIQIIDNKSAKFFIEIIKKQWISDIYNSLKKYITISKNDVYISQNDSINDSSDDIVIKINFILKTMINDEEVSKFLMRYISYYKESWDEVNDHIENIRLNLINYLKEKIVLSMK